MLIAPRGKGSEGEHGNVKLNMKALRPRDGTAFVYVPHFGFTLDPKRWHCVLGIHIFIFCFYSILFGV